MIICKSASALLESERMGFTVFDLFYFMAWL